jgi:hypothetical protein
LMLISYIDNLPFWSDHESEIQLGLKAISAWRVPHSIAKVTRRSICKHFACAKLQGCIKFRTIYKPLQNSRRHEGDMKQAAYWGHTNIRRYSIKSSGPNDLAPGIYALLLNCASD